APAVPGGGARIHPGGTRRSGCTHGRGAVRRRLRPRPVGPFRHGAGRRGVAARRPGRQPLAGDRGPGRGLRPARSARRSLVTGPHDDLLFPPEPTQRAIARELFALAADQPLISPHGHVDPAILADNAPFPDPAQLIIVPDHYLTRMLHSQGVPPARLGVPTRTGEPVETDGRAIWRTFAAHWHLFRGTPSRLWLERTFTKVFGVETPLSPKTADEVYDALAARLAEPEFRPRALFDRFGIEVLATPESPTDELVAHSALAADGWGGPGGRVITTFRPDNVVDPEFDDWAAHVDRLGALTGEDTGTYRGYLDALRRRREDFIKAGATSTDHGHLTARA